MLKVPRAKNVRGFSFFGDSYLYILFDKGVDQYWARSRVLEALSQISSELPSNAKSQLGPDSTGVGWIYQYALIDKTNQYDISQLTSLQNWFLKYELQTIPNVSELATIGGMVKQYQITININKLKAYSLRVKDIITAIQDSNNEVGGSVLEMAEYEYMIRTNGYLENKKDIENIPIILNSSGKAILLKDIATVSLGPEMRRGVADLNGEGDSVGAVVVMREGKNALATIKNIKNKLEEIKKSLPKGVEIITTYDRSSLIMDTIDNLKLKLIEEFIIVVLVCFLFLFHIRSSFVILISLPVGILISFMLMKAQGINANIMSLGGIAIAIGAMVDAAIVMIDNYHRHLEIQKNKQINRWQVLAKASSEVGGPIFFSLLIMTFSFLPVFTLQAQECKLFSPLAFTKTYAMAASAGLAITLVPVLMGYLIRGKIISENKNPINRLLVYIYNPILSFVLNNTKKTILLCLVVLLTGLYPMNKLGYEFIPDIDEGDLMYMPTLSPGVSIGKAHQILQQSDRLIKSIPEVSTVFGKIGRADTATDPAPLTMIETIIQFKPRSEWRAGMTLKRIRMELDKVVQIPGVTNAWVMPIRTRIDMLSTGIKTPLGIKIFSSKLDEIEIVGKEIQLLLKNIPETSSVYSEKTDSGKYIDVNINRKKAADLGFSISEIQDIIETLIGGKNVSETIEGRERYPINIRIPQSERSSLIDIKNLSFVNAFGTRVQLKELANITIKNAPPIIKTENGRYMGLVLVDVKGDIGTYIDMAKRKLDNNLSLPVGTFLTFSGQYEYLERATAQLKIVIPVTLMIIILLLYLSFRNMKDILLIVLSLPLSIIGGLWLIYLLNYNFSIAIGVGFIALAGVSVEIGVLMIVYINQELRMIKEQNIKYTKEAIKLGALMRIRPIVMTVGSVVIGLMPILFLIGVGSEVMQRIAAPMVGGMVSAMILALILIPALYMEISLWKLRDKKS